MAQQDGIVTPKVDSSYHNGEDAEKGISTGVPMLNKYDQEGAPRRKKFLFWSLPKKQWIYALVGTIVGVLAVVLLILFLAIVPAIFQKQVDKVNLTVNHLDLLKMSGDRSSNDLTVEMSAHIVSDAMAAATMYETTATLSYQGKAFGTVTLPETELKKGKYEFDLVIKGPSVVVDQDAFRAVSQAIVESETVPVEVSAKVKIHAMGLSYGGLELSRTVNVKGLNQFSTPLSNITKITVPACEKEYFQLTTNITLVNDSEIGLDGIGTLNMSVYYEQQYLGQAISTDQAQGIPRGVVPKMFVLTVLRQNATVSALTNLLKAMIKGPVQFYITGNNADAVKDAVLLDKGLAALNMSVPYSSGLAPSVVTLNTTAACADLIKLIA